MNKNYICIMNAIILGILLNISLSFSLSRYATEEEKIPPMGATNLSFKSQFMHMMVHHNQVLLMSSIIVALVVGLSVWLGYLFNPTDKIIFAFETILVKN